jgi:hypothetical protein
MKGSETRLAQFTHLLESGAIARSKCSRDFLAALAPLLDSGVLTEDRSGAGRQLVVRDASAFRDFIQLHFPDVPVPANASSRLTGVARFRDAKAVSSDLPEIVTLRAWHEDAIHNANGTAYAAMATRAHGVFSFLLENNARYSLHGLCALVENPAVFTQFEHLRLPPRLAIYGRGRSSNRLIDWLAAQADAHFELLHLPDYDPVGLDEFTRLRRRLGPRVRLHIPDRLPALFARHANRDLLSKPRTRSLLAQLRLSQIPEVRTVLSLIEEHNAGLEHEALLILTT